MVIVSRIDAGAVWQTELQVLVSASTSLADLNA